MGEKPTNLHSCSYPASQQRTDFFLCLMQESPLSCKLLSSPTPCLPASLHPSSNAFLRLFLLFVLTPYSSFPPPRHLHSTHNIGIAPPLSSKCSQSNVVGLLLPGLAWPPLLSCAHLTHSPRSPSPRHVALCCRRLDERWISPTPIQLFGKGAEGVGACSTVL